MGKRMRAFGVLLMLLVFIRLKISKPWGSARALRFRVRWDIVPIFFFDGTIVYEFNYAKANFKV